MEECAKLAQYVERLVFNITQLWNTYIMIGNIFHFIRFLGPGIVTPSITDFAFHLSVPHW